MRAHVIVTHRVPGFHHWPGAEGDVAYLANKHRHVFWISVAWEVYHLDRDVEFHMAQRWVRDTFKPDHNFGAQSCEMIAKLLRDGLVLAGHRSPAWVEVSEDGEFTSRVEFE